MPDTCNDTIRAWEAGDISDAQALRTLASDYGEIDSQIAPLEAEKKAIRNAVEAIVIRLGGKAAASGLEFVITEPSERVSYDTRALDNLLAKLNTNGIFDIAEELAAARKVTTVSGSLRVGKERRK